MRVSYISANLGRRQLINKLGMDLAAGRTYTCIFVYAKESSEWFNTALHFNGERNLASVVMRVWPLNSQGLKAEMNGSPTYLKWNGRCSDLIHQISERKENFGHIALRMVAEENYKGIPLPLKDALAWSGFPEIEDFLDQAVTTGKIKHPRKNKYDPNKDANQPMLPWPIKE